MRDLWGALRGVTLGELLQLDFWIALVGLGGGLVVGLQYPERLGSAVAVAAGVVGVIIGAVLAGVAVQSAFLDQAFLRKIRAIGRDPIDYLVPFLFTATLGVLALLGLLILAPMSPTAWTPARATGGAVVGFLSFWSVASLLPGMATLVQFVRLRMDALDVPDDIDIAPTRGVSGG